MHERVIVVVLSVCLSPFDFGDYWQSTIDLSMNSLRMTIDGHVLPERCLFSDCGVVNPTDVLDFVIDNTEHNSK